MQITNTKLKDISIIFTGLPIARYIDKNDSLNQKLINNKSIDEMDTEFDITEEKLSSDIKPRFFSKKGDILYKVQQKSFAKEITTEVDALIPNTYIIIRVDTSIVNPSFLTHYLNDKRVEYEIQRHIDSTKIMKVNTIALKELIIRLPGMEVQNCYVSLINKVYERIDLKKKSIECDMNLVNSLYDEVIGDVYEK